MSVNTVTLREQLQDNDFEDVVTRSAVFELLDLIDALTSRCEAAERKLAKIDKVLLEHENHIVLRNNEVVIRDIVDGKR